MGGGAAGRDWDPGREADLFVQMRFMSALKEAQEIAAGKRKRAFLVLVHNMRCLNQQSPYPLGACRTYRNSAPPQTW